MPLKHTTLLMSLLVVLVGCTPDTPPPTATIGPTETRPAATPTGIGTPIAIATSGSARLEIVSAHADPLQVRVEYVLYNLPPELLSDPLPDSLSIDAKLDLRAVPGWSQQSAEARPGSIPGTLAGEIRYTQENPLTPGETVRAPIRINLTWEPVLRITAAPSAEAIETAEPEVSIELLHSFSVTLELPVVGPFHNIDVGQSQTVSDVTMTVQGAWVSQTVVRVVFCPDPALDDTWAYTLVGDFDGVEVFPDFRGHYDDLSYYCAMYDYALPGSTPIDTLTFRIDKLYANPLQSSFTQAEIDTANAQLADQGIALALSGEGHVFVAHHPEDMPYSGALEIALDTLVPPIIGPWAFSVDLP